MAIKTLSVSNFKSFSEIQVDLKKFNVLIGANAAGKSNFIQVFKFLRDINQHGLNDAISLQGGPEYIKNAAIGFSKNLSIRVISDHQFGFGGLRSRQKTALRTRESEYYFSIAFKKRRGAFEITEDKLTLKCDFLEMDKRTKPSTELKNLGQGEIVLSRVGDGIKRQVNLPEGVQEGDLWPPPDFFAGQRLPSRSLLLETQFYPFSVYFRHSEDFFTNLSIYDFDPKLAKKAVPIIGKTSLEEDGSNLAVVLKNIRTNAEKRRKFTNLIRDLLPFVDTVNVEKFADRSLLFKLREKYNPRFYLPASLVSDGTINVIALILAVYFEERPLIVIEEPERNVHPFLVSKVTNMLKDAATRKQILVTTHNPQFVKHADLESLLLVARDQAGFSTVSRPADLETVRTFLENEIGIDELFTQNLLNI
jgi:predicted ATPase